MKINFEQDDQLSNDEINITIKASHLSNQVVDLIHQLEQIPDANRNVVPISLEDHVQMVNIENIIAIEVFNNDLVFHTIEHDYSTHGQLKNVLNSINDNQFIQISRSVAININHLKSLEAGFSGNMTAFLTNHLKLNVSRKYLPALKERLRM